MDQLGRTGAHYAAIEGDCTALAEIARREPQLLELADRDGMTPLHFAAQDDRSDAVKTLIDLGGAIDPEDDHGNTPLMKAVHSYRGDARTAEALLVAGADPDKENRHGQTPRGLAELIANTDVRKIFERR